MKDFRINKLFIVCLIPSIFTVSSCFTKDRAIKSPNVILFLADDLGWSDLHCQGSVTYETPNIDKFANDGIRFANAYVTHPRCVPSRYSIMTGKYPARNQIPGPGKMALSEYTIAEALKDEGYKTFFTGKWHLTFGGDSYPQTQGFDVNIGGGKAGAPNSHFFPYNEAVKPMFKDPIDDLEEGEKGEYLTDRLTDETIRFIRNHHQQNPAQPFFAMLSHYAVHEPLQAKNELIRKYQNKIDTINFPGDAYETESYGKTKLHQDNAIYAAMLHSLDESFGSIAELLNELKIQEETIVVFFSDNGGLSNTGTEERFLATSNYPLRAGKGHLYEGGIRVPLIVRWPGHGSFESAEIVTGADLFPTILDMLQLNLHPEQHLDGQSFKWALEKKTNPMPERELFWHNAVPRPVRTGDFSSTAIRKGKYKLIEFYDQNRVELYDLQNDPEEKYNLSDLMPEVSMPMLNRVHQWRKEINAYIKPKNEKTKWED